VKHAGSDALDGIEPLLEQLRGLPGLKEKSRGCFYLGGRGYLHFHEHGEDELYADVGVGDFERLPAMTAGQRKIILKRAMMEVRALLAAKKR
jgi:hypothetical protein